MYTVRIEKSKLKDYFNGEKEINIMKKEYTLILTTTEEKPYNKFNHLIMERIDNELQCLDIVKEEFPKVTVRQTKKELDWLVNYLKENGFEVTVQE